jgi:hypothetical protein
MQALLYAVIRAYISGVPPSSTLPTKTPVSTVSLEENAATSTGLSRKEASSLIHKWQKAKAAALGARHSLTELPVVLDGDLLRQWSERANELSTNGWHYDHRLYSCQVIDVDAGSTADKAIITAAFKEGVTVHKGSITEPQTFTSEYEVMYTARKQSEGTWVLISAQVKSPQASKA